MSQSTEVRELLELAAKAAGYEIDSAFDDCPLIFSAEEPPRDWDPANDDGDSKRLAVRLRIRVTLGPDALTAEWADDGEAYICHGASYADHDGNADDAWRWAVLQVAAQIGRSMP